MMRGVRSELPSGTVTFVFTDVEGSTKLLHELGAEAYAEALAAHRRIVREALAAHGGVEVDTQGDAFFVAFPTARGAVAAAGEVTERLAAGPIRVRVGVHTGTPYVGEEGYVGVDVHRAARVAACGHGGQVLLSATTAGLVDGDGLLDLGEHRLKDLAAPERILQLGHADFPPLKSLHRTNLPIPATPFLGRERELAEVSGLLAKDGVRLLTLTGPGGTGKTRMGLQAAAEAADHFPDGIFWVPLATLREPELVLATAGQAVGATDDLSEHISDRTLLLVLDNFEHVADAAADVLDLLAACPNLCVLITSRELLRVPGEQAYPVAPLEPQDGSELFLARARALDPAFVSSEAVPELCARLEQLPLALELAAARVRVLSPEQLLARLSQRLDLLKAGRGVDPRQQTLRATIEWSHDLLDTDEQQLFARLAVFAGGCTLEAAEGVCEADIDVLQSLVDKSLVRVREGERFWMLETIREYAIEKLERTGERDEVASSHAFSFLAVAEEAEPYLVGRKGATDWLDRLEREHDNLRAALARFDTAEEAEELQRLAGALTEFWIVRGPLVEGREWMKRALAADSRLTPARAKALISAAELASYGGDSGIEVRTFAEEAMALYERSKNLLGIARCKAALAYAFWEQGQLQEARQVAEESLRGYEAVGAEDRALWARRSIAAISISLGQIERARELHEANLVHTRRLGNRRAEATTLGAMAMLVVDEPGRLPAAISMLVENMPIFIELGDELDVETNLCRSALVLALAGDVVVAAKLLAQAELALRELGVRQNWLTKLNDLALELIHAKLAPDAFDVAQAEGAALSVEAATTLAMAALEGQSPQTFNGDE